MPEAIVLSVIQNIASTIAGQALTNLGSLIPPLSNVHSRLENIKSIFVVMSASLKDIDATKDYNHTVAAWAKQVREVAYEVEDIVDQYSYLTTERHQRDFKDLFSNIIPSFRDARTWHQIATDLQKIETRLNNLTNMRNQFGINTSQGTPSMISSSHDNEQIRRLAESSHFKPEDEILGIEENRDVIENRLTDNEAQRDVIAVWGMAGVGKTTLVTNVYKRQKKGSLFNSFTWISVSQTYTIDGLLKNIIHDLFQDKREAIPDSLNTMGYRNLVQILQDFLNQKKYLIILDDVWSTEVWANLNIAFLDSKLGSRIIITTRVYDVAIHAASKSHMIKLQPLEEDVARTLFCMAVFGKDTKRFPQALEELTQKFLHKCRGLPLAIVCIGRLLSLKDKDMIMWQRIYDGLNIGRTDSQDLQNVHNIFSISFSDLPVYLKNCLLYCSMFPEDYNIRRKRLIRLWIAEGFVEKQGSNSLEEAAEGYLNELIHRCLFQINRINRYGRVSRCSMHDLIRDFILTKSREYNFCEVYPNYGDSELSGGIRRLSISTITSAPQLETAYHLRSILVFDPKASFTVNFFSSFRLLKVLDMSYAPIEEIPNEIYHLFNLHYLGLRETNIKKISKSLGRLQNLQTLDVRRTNLGKLPSTVAKLKRLRHLIAGKCVPEFPSQRDFVIAPNKICDLVDLQTLKSIAATDEIIKQIGNLTQLRSFDIGWVTESQSEGLFLALSKMEKLRNSVVVSKDDSIIFNLEALPSLPPYLEKLYLQGKFPNGMLPQWFSRLVGHLKVVTLYNSCLVEDPLPALGLFPNLSSLCLGNAYIGQTLCFQKGWFPQLSSLLLQDLDKLNSIEIRREAMPKLSVICLQSLEELKLVQGIEYLPCLRELVLYEMPNELIHSLQDTLDNKDDTLHACKILVAKNRTIRDGRWYYEFNN